MTSLTPRDPTQYVYTTPYFTVQMVAEGVYASISEPGTGSLGNVGIVDLGEAALVFDTCLTLPAARALRATAERLVGKPVKYVVNSHYNADHILGNQVFPEALVVSTEGTRALMATRGADNLAQMRMHPEYPQELARKLAQTQDAERRRSLEIELGDMRAVETCLPELELRLPMLVAWGGCRIST